MNRRQFLKLGALASLGLAAPLVRRTGHTQAAGYGGPFWVLVHAGGAWDPRFLFDPIASGDQNRHYTQIGSAGNIQFADYPVDIGAFNLDPTQGYDPFLMAPRDFATKHGPRFTVLNGIDTSTNNHEAGTRAIWSGRLLGEYPAFGALVAAARAPDQPMAFISSGGYDVTSRLVPLARVDSASTLAKVAYPNLSDPTDPTTLYHTDETRGRIRAAAADRLAALRGASTLPREQSAMDELLHARGASGTLARLTLPATLIDIPGYQLDDLQRMVQASQIAVAAFQSGVAAVATIVLDGFDTHGSHDRDQPKQITKLLHGLDFLLGTIDAAGLGGQTYLVVGSDFGRGPIYNSDRTDAGKDHWPVTSMMVAGPGIPGDRVIGSTDAGMQPIPVDPASLAPSPDGVKLTPEVVHAALRRVAGVEANATSYPLGGDVLPLFG